MRFLARGTFIMAAVVAVGVCAGVAQADVTVGDGTMTMRSDVRVCKPNGQGYYGRYAVYDIGNGGFSWGCVK